LKKSLFENLAASSSQELNPAIQIKEELIDNYISQNNFFNIKPKYSLNSNTRLDWEKKEL